MGHQARAGGGAGIAIRAIPMDQAPTIIIRGGNFFMRVVCGGRVTEYVAALDELPGLMANSAKAYVGDLAQQAQGNVVPFRS